MKCIHVKGEIKAVDKTILGFLFFINLPYKQGTRSPLLASYRCISGILRVQFGNNLAIDMLEQYGDFGIK
jgi:hypothetical protein